MPTIMSDRGKLKLDTTSDIVRCLEDATEEQYDIFPSVKVVRLDGPDIMNELKHAAARTFLEYAQDMFLPYVEHQLSKPHIMYIVWDNYTDQVL